MAEEDESDTASNRLNKDVTVGRILREAREQQDVKLRPMARRMGRAHSSLVAWEYGHTVVHEDTVREYELKLGLPHKTLTARIERVLGADWDDSFSRTRSRTQRTEFEPARRAWKNPILRLYGSILHDVTYEEPGNFTEITRYTYLVAEDDQDVVIEEHKTTVHGPEPMRWRHFSPGALPGSGGVESYDDLTVEAWCSSATRVEMLPLNLTEFRAKLVAFFLPPLKPQTINWGVKYTWPGLWNPLRLQGQDDGRIYFRPFTTRAVITVVAPRPDCSLTFVSRNPTIGNVATRTWTAGGIVLPGVRWSVDDPNGALDFTVALRRQAKAGA